MTLKNLIFEHMGKSNYREVDCPECLRIVKKKYNLSDAAYCNGRIFEKTKPKTVRKVKAR